MKEKVSIFIALLILSFVNPATAQTTGDYRSRQTGVWSSTTSWQMYDGSNWVNAATAPSSSNGIITILPGHVITSNGTLTADQIVVNSGGTLSITGGTFTLNTSTAVDLDCSGTFALSNSTFNGSGTITCNSGSTFNWANGYNGGSGIMNINAGAIVNVNGSGITMADTKTINNYGVWNWTAGPFYYNNGSPVFNNYGTFNISTDDDVSRLNTNTGTFNNLPAGIINKIGSPSDETSFNNISSFTNGGTINVNSGKLKLNINSVHTGAINIAFGANMNFSAGVAFLNSGSVLSGAGYLNFEGGADTINAASIAVNNISVSGGTVNITPSITITNGRVLNLSGGVLTGAGILTFESNSIFNWTGGYCAGSSVININAGAELNMAGGNLYIADTKTINNYGTWTWTSGAFYYNNGAPVINNFGTFNINTDNDLGRVAVNTGSFNNTSTGIINKIGSPSDETSFNSISSFNNAGTVNVNSGNLSFNVAGTHNGLYEIDFGAQLRGSVIMTITGGTFINNGIVALTGLTFSGSAVQSLDGDGIINTLTINNTSGVLLTEAQAIAVKITINNNSKLTVYRDLIIQ